MDTQVWLYLWAQANAGEKILRSCQEIAAFNSLEANALLVAAAATTPRLRISWRSSPSPSQHSEPSPHVVARFVALIGLLLATVSVVTWLLWKWRPGSGGSLVKARRKQHSSGGARHVTVVTAHQGSVRRRASKGVRRTETAQPPPQPQSPKPCASQAAPAKAPPTNLPPQQQQQPPQQQQQ